MEKTEFYCDFAALSTEQRDRLQSMVEPLFQSVSSIDEQPHGYDIIFPMNFENFTRFAEFVVYEGLCCPFLSFAISVESGQDYATVSITGSDEAKPFIKSELGLA